MFCVRLKVGKQAGIVFKFANVTTTTVLKTKIGAIEASTMFRRKD